MKDSHGFPGDLLGPVHSPGLRSDLAAKRPDETEITGAWRFEFSPDADAMIRNAAEDLRDFLSVSMGVSVERCERGAASEPCIVLRVDDALPGESYRITVRPDQVEVRGGDAGGVMYGCFHVESLMQEREAPLLAQGSIERRPAFETRILRSYHSPYYENELDSDEDYYTDAYLARLAHESFNGIWLHQRLRDLVTTRTFPEYGQDAEPLRPLPFGMQRTIAPTNAARRMTRLNALIVRARRWGIGVHLYLNEPRAFPADSAFYQRHPGAAGHRESWNEMEGSEQQDYYALCTSDPDVLCALEEAAAALFRQATGLAGVFLITQSEHLTHCWSRTFHTKGEKTNCPRCLRRDPTAIIPEVVSRIYRGATSVNPGARVIAWNWSWENLEDAPFPRIIAALPRGVKLMPDFERGTFIEEGGLRWRNDEYTLSRPGPSQVFTQVAKACRTAGHPIYAKIQIGNTHELANTPFIPVPFKLFEKFAGLRREGVTGYLGCWIHGNHPSVMTAVAHEMSWLSAPTDPQELLRRIASRRYGPAAADAAVAAWRLMSEAFGRYPLSQPVIYFSPVSYAPLWHFRLRCEGRPSPRYWLARTAEDMGDMLEWAKLDCERKTEKMIYEGPIRAEYVLGCFAELAAGWSKGVTVFHQAVSRASPAKRLLAERDAGIAESIGIHWNSTVRIMNFLMARDRFEAGDASARDAMLRLMKDELGERRRFLELVRQDSRIGFHSEFGCAFRAADVEAAIQLLKRQIESAAELQ